MVPCRIASRSWTSSAAWLSPCARIARSKIAHGVRPPRSAERIASSAERISSSAVSRPGPETAIPIAPLTATVRSLVATGSSIKAASRRAALVPPSGPIPGISTVNR